MATHWVRSADVVWEEMSDETLLVRPATGQRWSLNATAASIWKACDGAFNLEKLAAKLAQASGRHLAVCRNEIAEFCATFTHLGLLAAGQPTPLTSAHTVFQQGSSLPPGFRQLSVGGSSRRRPSPRGISGPG